MRMLRLTIAALVAAGVPPIYGLETEHYFELQFELSASSLRYTGSLNEEHHAIRVDPAHRRLRAAAGGWGTACQ